MADLKNEFTKGFAWGLGLGCGVQLFALIAVFCRWVM